MTTSSKRLLHISRGAEIASGEKHLIAKYASKKTPQVALGSIGMWRSQRWRSAQAGRLVGLMDSWRIAEALPFALSRRDRGGSADAVACSIGPDLPSDRRRGEWRFALTCFT